MSADSPTTNSSFNFDTREHIYYEPPPILSECHRERTTSVHHQGMKFHYGISRKVNSIIPSKFCLSRVAVGVKCINHGKLSAIFYFTLFEVYEGEGRGLSVGWLIFNT